ncbi:uncharacterized protein BJX67DRAFT_297078 [Aspergillus lucknowensis]|uniref:Uncharacterized protein n=1 Tax=Aspergillus lucknowensis TaxID=176173 RepID=A0ABR4LCX0_9EURO
MSFPPSSSNWLVLRPCRRQSSFATALVPISGANPSRSKTAANLTDIQIAGGRVDFGTMDRSPIPRLGRRREICHWCRALTDSISSSSSITPAPKCSKAPPMLVRQRFLHRWSTAVPSR